MNRLVLLAALLAGCVQFDVSARAPVGVNASPVPSTPGASQEPVRFQSDGTSKGAQGPFRLLAGRRIFKATHAGRGNFVVQLRPVADAIGAQLAFNEIGKGTWEWARVVDAAGEYYLEVQAADGAWTLAVD